MTGILFILVRVRCRPNYKSVLCDMKAVIQIINFILHIFMQMHFYTFTFVFLVILCKLYTFSICFPKY